MPQPHIRLAHSAIIHNSFSRIVRHMLNENRTKLHKNERELVLRQLNEIKEDAEHHNLGATQTKILNTLISRARNAKTFEDLMDIHSNTCLLGLDKH